MRLRMFEIMQECDKVNIDKIREWLSPIDADYLCIKHDKDITREHYHIFIRMKNAREIEDISKQCEVSSNFIQKIKSWKNALAYAFHLTDSAREDEKAEYNENDVIFSHNVDIKSIFECDKIYQEEKAHNEKIVELLIQYGNCEISKSQLIKEMNAEDYNKHALTFKKMQEFRQMKVSERDMKVLYITGASGSGKTTFAKYMAQVMCYDYFVSGSGKDILDGYDKEECIILDDLRGDVFTKAELFKLTDNNTNSSVKSRFKNKDISRCKLMIITSVKSPNLLYNWNDDTTETYTQFARRLSWGFMSINDSGDIFECYINQNDFKVSCNMVKDFNMNDVFKVLGITRQFSNNFMKEIYSMTKKEILKNKPVQMSLSDIDENDFPF